MERAVIMTGVGGQGIQLIAKLLAHAAMSEGRQVIMFGLFMGTIRGGASESTVVVGDGEIVTPPLVPRAWAVLAMHGDGLAKLAAKAEAGGVLLVNSSLVAPPATWPTVRVIAVPATALAKEIGQPMGASMVALGALAAATGVVAVGSLTAALDVVLPAHRRALIDGNRRCLARGAAYVAEPVSEARG
jgi:Pyruvate/2-oxoacid:ferredoxin oxidoreductase gamma subunit